jgi:actin-related protein
MFFGQTQATLALYAAQRTSGIVVNIGFQVTSVVPSKRLSSF